MTAFDDDSPTPTNRLRLRSFEAGEALRAARELMAEDGVEFTAAALVRWCDERIARPGMAEAKVRALTELRDAIVAAALAVFDIG